MNMMSTAETQLRNLRRSLLLILIIFLIPFGGILWLYQRHIDRTLDQKILDDAHANAIRTQYSFEQLLQVATSHVARIESEFQDAMHLASDQFKSKARFEVPLAMRDRKWQEKFGTLLLRSELSNPELSQHEIYAFYATLPSIRAAHQTHRYFQWTSYYASRGDLLGLYPYASLDDLKQITKTQNQDGVLDAIIDDAAKNLLLEVGPDKNPERQYQWTNPYFDNGGKGAMITIIAPQYFNKEYVGAMTTDLSLRLFDHALKDEKRLIGHIAVITSNNDVIADDQNKSINSQRILKSEDVMPSLLENHMRTSATNKTGSFQSIGDWRYLALPINSSRWQLRYYFSEEELQVLRTQNRKETIWGVFILLSVLAVAALVITYLFALPSIRLIQFLIDIERGSSDVPKHVPNIWKHAFHQILATSRERNDYLRALSEQANQLEETVTLRTKELRHQREVSEKARKDIAIISDSGRQITASLDMNEITDTVYTHLKALVPLDSFSIGTLDILQDEVNYSLVLVNDQTMPTYRKHVNELSPNLKKAILNKCLQVSFDPIEERTEVHLPLVLHEDCIGIISLRHKLSQVDHNNALDVIHSLAAYVTIALDNATTVQQLKETQDKLIEQEKLAALGSIVAGVAHELNTPIGNALLTASSLSDMTHSIKLDVETSRVKRSSLLTYSENIITACSLLVKNLESAAQLITSFKQIAVDQSSDQRRIFSLLSVTQEIVSTFESRIKRSGHQISVNIDKDLIIDSFPGPYSQLISHLIVNSLEHAFEGREQGWIRIQAALNPARDEINLQFEDNGIGIQQQHISRIFEPFFTTKLGHGGSGLGLHICYNIVTAVLGGSIAAQSTIKQGTLFSITFPRNPPIAHISPTS